MKIPEDALNVCIEFCIDQFVRLEEHRTILREHWFGGMSTYELMKAHNLSDTSIKRILKSGDRILLKAADMSENLLKKQK